MLNPDHVRAQIEQVKLIYPDLITDDDAWDITLASETDLDAALNGLIAYEAEAAAMAGAMATRMANLEARQKRYERRSQAAREVIKRLLQTAGVRKRELPEATVSLAAARSRTVVLDCAAVPDDLCRIKREPDLTKIKAFIDAGNSPNWAVIQSGSETLNLRSK